MTFERSGIKELDFAHVVDSVVRAAGPPGQHPAHIVQQIGPAFDDLVADLHWLPATHPEPASLDGMQGKEVESR
jgi:hypothetical protein